MRAIIKIAAPSPDNPRNPAQQGLNGNQGNDQPATADPGTASPEATRPSNVQAAPAATPVGTQPTAPAAAETAVAIAAATNGTRPTQVVPEDQLTTQQRDQLRRLKRILRTKGWIPTLPDNHELVIKGRQAIIETIYQDDREYVGDTLRLTVYHPETDSWGIVNEPVDDVYAFRFKNPVSDRLKRIVEKLVKDLDLHNNEGRVPDNAYRIIGNIEVLEPDNRHRALHGKLLPKRGRARWEMAVAERRIEAITGIVAIICALLLMVISYPSNLDLVFSGTSDVVQKWIVGFMERLATSVIVIFAVSWLEILLHWTDLSRQSDVKWELD